MNWWRRPSHQRNPSVRPQQSPNDTCDDDNWGNGSGTWRTFGGIYDSIHSSVHLYSEEVQQAIRVPPRSAASTTRQRFLSLFRRKPAQPEPATPSSSASQGTPSSSWLQASVWDRIDDLNDELEDLPILSEIERATGIPPSYLVIGLFVLFLALVVFGFGSRIACLWVGYVVPMYTSLRVIQEPRLPVIKHLLCYWLVFFLFVSMEGVIDQSMSWLPFYYPLKLAALYWCFSPESEGASRLFKSGIRPFIRTHRASIDTVVDGVDAIVETTLMSTARGAASTTGQGVEVVYEAAVAWVKNQDELHTLDAMSMPPASPPPEETTPTDTPPSYHDATTVGPSTPATDDEWDVIAHDEVKEPR